MATCMKAIGSLAISAGEVFMAEQPPSRATSATLPKSFPASPLTMPSLDHSTEGSGPSA